MFYEQIESYCSFIKLHVFKEKCIDIVSPLEKKNKPTKTFMALIGIGRIFKYVIIYHKRIPLQSKFKYFCHPR